MRPVREMINVLFQHDAVDTTVSFPLRPAYERQERLCILARADREAAKDVRPVVADEGASPKLALRERPCASALDLSRLADEVEDAAEELGQEDGSDGYFLCFFLVFVRFNAGRRAPGLLRRRRTLGVLRRRR